MSAKLLNSVAFRFMRWRFGMRGSDRAMEQAVERMLVQTIDGCEMLDAAVVLAFDGVHDNSGRFDAARTHLYVTNDYVMELAARHRKILFGASVHPYRPDAVDELERCIASGAVLLKWLPIVQGFDPSDPRCIPFYEALAHHKLPLLCHTGGERSLPRVDDAMADPALLVPALKRGVTVIMAHCGTRSFPGETDYVGTFVRLAKEFENCFGDTSALNLPMRSHAYGPILDDDAVRRKLVHGSDWPIIALPPISRLGVGCCFDMLAEGNWMLRDILIKQKLGFDADYWRRAGTLLRLTTRDRREARRHRPPAHRGASGGYTLISRTPISTARHSASCRGSSVGGQSMSSLSQRISMREFG
jgi:predicted TIM-barrel fold metal-dependent hydrolase